VTYLEFNWEIWCEVVNEKTSPPIYNFKHCVDSMCKLEAIASTDTRGRIGISTFLLAMRPGLLKAAIWGDEMFGLGRFSAIIYVGKCILQFNSSSF
jgi:hypothetical protein